MNDFSKSLSSAMTPLYVDKFKLTQAPFIERYTESLFYEDETRKEILKKITHLTDYTNLILFVQGAEGLGKTSLIKHRLTLAKPGWRVCYFNSSDYVTSEAFVDKVFKDFQLKYSSQSHNDQPTSIHEQIESLYQSGLTPVIIIDDVDKLNRKLIPTLQSLISLNADKRPLIRLIIAGEDIPNYLLKIIPVENGQVTIKYLPLPPLSEKETAAYIRYKLANSGYNQNEPFNKSILRKIYLDSKGFPKYINHLADHVMGQYMHSAGNKKSILPINDDNIKKLKWIASGLATIVIFALLYISFESNETDSPETELTTNAASLPDPASNLQMADAETAVEVEKIENIPEEKAIEKISSEKIETPVIRQELIPDKMARPVAPDEIAKPVTPEVRPQTEKINPEARIVADQKKSVVKKQESATEKKLPPEIAWINKQNPEHYTLQLTGSSSEKAAISFIKKHGVEKDAIYFHTIRKGKDWYSVIYKSYPNGRSAREAIQNLPDSLKKIKPWIRPFKDIKKDLE